jgi:3-hydroxyisobutyrate dehydrogenase-like beta-hydroxyacid dehydrogenase
LEFFTVNSKETCSMKLKIGFMGLGIMGVPMAANLLKAGHPVMVYNRTPQKAQPLIKQGAGLASHPKALAKAADVVIAMVTGPEALGDLLWGPDGAGGAFNRSKVFINMSSVSPRYTRELARELEPTGVAFIDAPVSGTRKPAEDGPAAPRKRCGSWNRCSWPWVKR